MKSCKNQPNASISIMSGRSDLLSACWRSAGCLSSHNATELCSSSVFPPAWGDACALPRWEAAKKAQMPQRSEMWPGGISDMEAGSFEVPSEGSDFGGDGVALTPTQSRTWFSTMDDGRK